MATELDPHYNGHDLNTLAPELPLADKLQIAGQTSAFLHATPRFMLEALLRATWKQEQAERN